MAKGRVDAVGVPSDTTVSVNAARVAAAAARQRLPLVGPPAIAQAGGLIGYGANVQEMYRRSAYFVDKILKGAKPADIPVEQATKIGLTLNQKTAQALGITFPQALIVRADEVIE